MKGRQFDYVEDIQVNATTKGYYKKWLPEVLSSVAVALE